MGFRFPSVGKIVVTAIIAVVAVGIAMRWDIPGKISGLLGPAQK